MDGPHRILQCRGAAPQRHQAAREFSEVGRRRQEANLAEQRVNVRFVRNQMVAADQQNLFAVSRKHLFHAPTQVGDGAWLVEQVQRAPGGDMDADRRLKLSGDPCQRLLDHRVAAILRDEHQQPAVVMRLDQRRMPMP